MSDDGGDGTEGSRHRLVRLTDRVAGPEQPSDAVTRKLGDQVLGAATPEEARQWTLVRALNAKVGRDERASRADEFEKRAEALFPYVRLVLATVVGSAFFAFGYLPAALLVFGVGFSPNFARFIKQIKTMFGNGGGGHG